MAIACALAFVQVPQRARAQGVSAQIFEPPAGTSAAFTIPEPALDPNSTLQLGVGLDLARWPLVRATPCYPDGLAVDAACARTQGRTPVVSNLIAIDTSLALWLADSVQLGLSLPVMVVRAADNPITPEMLESNAGIAGVRISLMGPLLAGDTALALRGVLSIATGDAEALYGEPSATLTPELVLRQRVQRAAFSAQLGLRIREEHVLLGLEQDEELQGALGLRVPLLHWLELRAELRARIGLATERANRNQNPVEADAGASFPLGKGLQINAGAGAGMWPGRSGYGAPLLRVFARVHYAIGDDGADADGDQREDGLDLCPQLREDADDFEDQDGCPDLDDDGDGRLDKVDQCPRSSEDRDGFEDADGCPEPDNDEDSIADADDGCAMDPEDRDGFEDGDGCPEPGPQPAEFSVGEERILVSERIYFDYDADTIRNVSMPVLDGLAEVINGLGSGMKVLVEGHTDDSGNAAYDLDLSFRRARAVVAYLRGRGVSEDRLDFVGRGAAQPLAPGHSTEARALNRRVEFRLLR